jgi:transcriptional regulator with PAS, ATPase and Fis domain
MINDMQCGENAKLMPLLHSYDDVCRLNKENSRLKEKISKLNFILDSVDSAVYVKNSKQIVTYVNQKFMNLLSEKFGEEEIMGHKFSDLLPINELKSIINLENEAFKGNSIYNKSIIFPFCDQAKMYIVSIVPNFSKNRANEIIATLTPHYIQ